MTGLSVTVNEGATVLESVLRPSAMLFVVLVLVREVEALKDNCDVMLFTDINDGVSTYFRRTKFRSISSSFVCCKTSL